MQRSARMRGTVQRSRILLVIVLALTIAVVVVAYYAGSLRASESPSGATVEESLKMLGEAEDGDAVVTVSEERDEVCAAASVGRGGGVSCTYLDAPDPMVSVTGSESASAEAHVVVVDPQERLDILFMERDGEVVEASSKDGGLSIDARVAATPDSLLLLDADGEQLAAEHPKAVHDEVNDEWAKIVESYESGPGGS